MKTETELATAVLKHLGVIGNGQSPDAEDLADVTAAYRSKYDEIAAPGMDYGYWLVEEIPDALFLTLRDLIALEVQTSFGQPVDAATKDALEIIVLKRLRRHTGRIATGLPVQSEFM